MFVKQKLETKEYCYFCSTNIRVMDLNFNKNEDYNKLLVRDLNKRLASVKLGGGASKITKEHTKGKLTARERIDYLLDPKSKSIEIGAFACIY